MSVSDRDLKILWAKSAGRCAFPGCTANCVELFAASGNVVVGEMAHVIARSKKGPRGTSGVEERDVYENLILLCPTHHTVVDKAPGDFPTATLQQWKAALEQHVSQSLRPPSFSSKAELFSFATRLLSENKMIYDQFGPSSPAAQRDPLSTVINVWNLRKLTQIVPNNERIVLAFEHHASLVPQEDWVKFARFREHANAFHLSAVDRMDAVPMFPSDFGEMVREES